VTEAVLALTTNELLALYSYVPQWRGLIVGPRVPFGDGRAASIQVSAIFVPTREDAERVLMGHARHRCETERMEFDEDDWTVQEVGLIRAS
jgi:hypothetical protein